LEAGSGIEAASFLGGFAVGVVSAWLSRRKNLPVAVIAFAGAVTMMPGIQIYSALRGAVQLVRLQGEADVSVITGTLTQGMQATGVVAALSLGLIVAIRAVQALPGGQARSPSVGN
jgi:uncharacterized membrane protein YjjB (DUF3815 family)